MNKADLTRELEDKIFLLEQEKDRVVSLFAPDADHSVYEEYNSIDTQLTELYEEWDAISLLQK